MSRSRWCRGPGTRAATPPPTTSLSWTPRSRRPRKVPPQDAPGSAARIYQHPDIGQGEVNWDDFFAGLAGIGLDGIATVCVFAWEDRTHESCLANREKLERYLAKHF